MVKIPSWVKRIDVELDLLSIRAKEVKMLIRKRAVLGQYNLTEQARLLRVIKKAKSLIAEAGFI